MKAKILYALLLTLFFSGAAMAGETGYELYQSLTTQQKDKALKIIQLYEDYKKSQNTPMTAEERKDLADFTSEIKDYEKLSEAEKLKFIEWLQNHDMINTNTRHRNRGAAANQTPAEKAQINLDSARRWIRPMNDDAKAEFIKFAPEYLKAAGTGQIPYFADAAKMKGYMDFQSHVDKKWCFIPKPDRVELVNEIYKILRGTHRTQAHSASLHTSYIDTARQQREIQQHFASNILLNSGSFVPPDGTFLRHLLNNN